MKRILIISYTGLSKNTADGRTLRALLSSYPASNLMQFCCNLTSPDFDACKSYFNVNDIQMIKSFIRKGSPQVLYKSDNSTSSRTIVLNNKKSSIVRFFKKNNYNFILRFGRELLWNIAPWGRALFHKWLDDNHPDAILYVVGENWFLDNLVLELKRKYGIPIILYNGEGYRLVDINKRRGIEKIYYKIIKTKYKELLLQTNLIIYNSDNLKEFYKLQYGDACPSIVAYNSSEFDTVPYIGSNTTPRIVYFGNLGVGRVDSILLVADSLKRMNCCIRVNVYGSTKNSFDEERLRAHSHVNYYGFIEPDELIKVKNDADILLHVESFDPNIIPKLKYAFSTKIAQYLTAGRCILCFAPESIISTQYLMDNDAAYVVTKPDDLDEALLQLCNDNIVRVTYAEKALIIAKINHDQNIIASLVSNEIESV